MNKKTLLTILLAGATVITVAGTTTFIANAANSNTSGYGNGQSTYQGRHFGGQGGYGREAMLEQKSEVLGITKEELEKEWQTGKNMQEIAAEKGISLDAWHDKMLEYHKEQLQESVSEGRITQEEADNRIGFIKERQETCPMAGGGSRGISRGRGI